MDSGPLQSAPHTEQACGAFVLPRPLRTRGRTLVVLLAIMALVDAFAVVADVAELAVIDRLLDDEDVPQREIDAAYDRFGLAGTFQSLAYLAVVLGWLAWIRRAYADVPLMGAGAERRFGTGWATGSWFVPILSFWRPKQITNDVWRATEPDPDQSVAFSDRPVPVWLAVWWVGWLIVGWTTNVVYRLLFESDALEALRSSTLITLICDAAWLPVDLIALAVVVVMTRRWENRRARL